MKLLVVEDEPLIAEDIAQTLVRNDFEVSGVMYTKEEALHSLQTNLPDMALLDINLNNHNEGIEIADWINQHIHIPFIFITSYSDKLTLEKAKYTEPSGYIVKPFTEAGLCSAVEIAFYNHTQKHKQNFPTLNLLKLNQKLNGTITEREFELLSLIYEGKTNSQIAEALFISVNTVKKHINNVYLKLDTISRSSTLVKLRTLMQS
jgi:DNA-binding NarL/FixJ family response regulator